MVENPFRSVTRVAIEQIIKSCCSESKYGFFVSGEDMERLVNEMIRFLETSRILKSAGDRILAPPPKTSADIRGNIR